MLSTPTRVVGDDRELRAGFVEVVAVHLRRQEREDAVGAGRLRHELEVLRERVGDDAGNRAGDVHARARYRFFPGLRRPFGSNAVLTASWSATAAGSHCRPRRPRLTRPRPCSPEMLPPSRTASSNSSSAARSARLALVLVRRVDQERRVEVAVARVPPAAGGELVPRADRERLVDRLGQPVEGDDDVLAHLAASLRLRPRARRRRASARAPRSRPPSPAPRP